MDMKSNNKIALSDTISIVASVLALIALYLSWEANSIAREANDIAKRANEVQLVILEFRGSRSNMPDTSTQSPSTMQSIDCAYNVRLANLGGVTAAITSYSVDLLYHGGAAQLPLTTSSRNEIAPAKSLGLDTGGIVSTLLNKTPSEHNPPVELWIDLPVSINAHEARDIGLLISFAIDTSKVTIEDAHNIFTETGFSPLEARLTLTTADGNTVSSDPSSCIHLK